MLLGEALAERAALQKELASLRERATANVSRYEGDAQVESVDELLAASDAASVRLEALIAAINVTNTATEVEPGVSITRALARRDRLSGQLATLEAVARAASPDRGGWVAGGGDRASVIDTDVRALRDRIAVLSAERRTLDAALQRRSWEVEVIGLP